MWSVVEFYLDRAASPLFLCLLCLSGLVIGLRYRFRPGARWFALGCGLMAVEHALEVAAVTLWVLLSTDVSNQFRSVFVNGSLVAIVVNSLNTMAGLACVIIGFAKITRRVGGNSEFQTPQSTS